MTHHPTTHLPAVDLTQLREWLNRHSITILRMSLGLVFTIFGVLKFFPGASPAEDLAIRTVDALTFGAVSGSPALWLTATVECFIGVTLISGKLIRTGLVTLGFALVGIMSPLVLFSQDMFASGPTLEAQYVFKDVVLAAAGMVIGAAALGSRLAER